MRTSMRTPFFVCCALAASVVAQPTFNPGTTVPVNTRPDGVVIADLNGDGIADLAVSSDLPDKITLHPGQGGGTYGASVIIPLGAGVSAQDLVSADFDLDGDLDLLVALDNSGGVQSLVNQGNFNFTPGVFRTTGAGARDIDVGDFNGDGFPDAAVSNRDSNSASVLLNVGGTLGTATSFAAGLDPRGIAAGDLTGDGLPELAVASHDNRLVNTFLNLGNGTFAPALSLSVGPNMRPEGVAIADIDQDGDGDVLAASNGGGFNVVSLFRTNGVAQPVRVDYPTGGIDPDRITAADMNGDGFVDAVVGHETSNNIAVLRNTAGTGFAAPVLLAGGVRAQQVAAGDLDGNGSLDLAAAFRDSNEVRTWTNTAGGTPSNGTLSLTAPAFVGTSTSLQLSSPLDAGRGYLCAFSGGTAPGFLLSDGRTVPLNQDFLFFLALQPNNGIFTNTQGTLNASGGAFVGINVPNAAGLVGATVYAAFGVLDPQSPSGVGTLSNALSITVQ